MPSSPSTIPRQTFIEVIIPEPLYIVLQLFKKLGCSKTECKVSSSNLISYHIGADFGLFWGDEKFDDGYPAGDRYGSRLYLDGSGVAPHPADRGPAAGRLYRVLHSRHARQVTTNPFP